MSDATERQLIWMGNSQNDLREFPEDVKDEIGFALHEAQFGRTPHRARMLHGMGSGVWEIRDDYRGDTFRAAYVVRFEDAVYVLHAFQKKAHSGGEMPREVENLLRSRLQELEAKKAQEAKQKKRT